MKRVARLVRRVGRRLLTLAPAPKAPPSSPAIPLTMIEEAKVLPHVPDPLGGTVLGSGAIGRPSGADVDFTWVKDVWFAPALGAVFDGRGRVFAGTVRETTLVQLPSARRQGEAILFTPPETAPALPRATVFMDWGAVHNYAGFLIEALPALLAARKAGALERFPAIAPPLSPWQADLLALAGAPPPTVVDAPLVRLGEAVFATPAKGPADGSLLDAVRTRILASLDAAPDGRRRIYLSRRASLKAVLDNEAELEAALATRGFAIVRPETASARELIALFRDAETIVASGTILANTLFCAPGAKVIEIHPASVDSAWASELARRAGADWRAFAGGPPEAPKVPLDPRLRPSLAFNWRLDIAAFLTFLDGGS